MQGQRDLAVVAELIMNELIPLVGGQQGAFFLADASEAEASIIAKAIRAARIGCTGIFVFIGHTQIKTRTMGISCLKSATSCEIYLPANLRFGRDLP